MIACFLLGSRKQGHNTLFNLNININKRDKKRSRDVSIALIIITKQMPLYRAGRAIELNAVIVCQVQGFRTCPINCTIGQLLYD